MPCLEICVGNISLLKNDLFSKSVQEKYMGCFNIAPEVENHYWIPNLTPNLQLAFKTLEKWNTKKESPPMIWRSHDKNSYFCLKDKLRVHLMKFKQIKTKNTISL